MYALAFLEVDIRDDFFNLEDLFFHLFFSLTLIFYLVFKYAPLFLLSYWYDDLFFESLLSLYHQFENRPIKFEKERVTPNNIWLLASVDFLNNLYFSKHATLCKVNLMLLLIIFIHTLYSPLYDKIYLLRRRPFLSKLGPFLYSHWLQLKQEFSVKFLVVTLQYWYILYSFLVDTNRELVTQVTWQNLDHFSHIVDFCQWYQSLVTRYH